jgi:hypothetical protein
MPRKPKRPPDDPEEYARFIEAAKKAGADESGEALDRVFEVIARRPKAKSG